MKKLLALVMVLALALPFAVFAADYDIAMITDIGTIDDKSFNQGTWEGIVEYADANNKTRIYYQPTAQSTEIYLDMIEQAVGNGQNHRHPGLPV